MTGTFTDRPHFCLNKVSLIWNINSLSVWFSCFVLLLSLLSLLLCGRKMKNRANQWELQLWQGRYHESIKGREGLDWREKGGLEHFKDLI